jgi:hypothetical protein
MEGEKRRKIGDAVGGMGTRGRADTKYMNELLGGRLMMME